VLQALFWSLLGMPKVLAVDFKKQLENKGLGGFLLPIVLFMHTV
jgi:hypothetical protein